MNQIFKRDLLLILLVLGFLMVFAMMRTSLYEDLNFDATWSTAIDFLVLGLALAFVVFIGLSVLTAHGDDPEPTEEEELMNEVKKKIREEALKDKKSKLFSHLNNEKL